MSLVLLSWVALAVAVLALSRAFLDSYLYNKRINELQLKTLEAQRMLRQRTNLANEIAHEIKNPITAILCSAEALDLLIGPQIDPVHRKSLQYIRESGGYMLQLVSDFLDLNRVEGGYVQSKPMPLCIADAIAPTIGLLESNAMRKQITIKNMAVDRELFGYVDPKHFKQILFNLVHNAIKFTPEKGDVHIEVKSDFPAPFLRVSVRDNGVGIPQDQLPRIFDLYARYEGAGAVPEPGLGVGLALCKRLVEFCGGTITVQSKVNVGTVFEFTVPQRAKPQQGETAVMIPAASSVADEKPLEGQAFLVVDEDAAAREAICHLIEAWGGMVDKVSLAVDAVEALAQKDYDAVMIDDTRDGVYGYELARIIRGNLKGDETTIIVASKNSRDAALAKDSGADKFIEKPLNGDALLRSLLNSGKYSVTH